MRSGASHIQILLYADVWCVCLASALTLGHYPSSTLRFWLHFNSALLNVAETLSPRAAIFLSDHDTNINKIDIVLFIIVIANSRVSWYFPGLEDSTGAQNTYGCVLDWPSVLTGYDLKVP